jgi:hypothetical protein
MDFDPNKPGHTKNYFWASYVPGRSTKKEFSLHSNRGHALNALQGGGKGILYRWDKEKNEWIEFARCEGNLNTRTHCDKCGDALTRYEHTHWVGPKRGEKYYVYGGSTKWDDLKTDSPKMIRVCNDCYYGRPKNRDSVD